MTISHACEGLDVDEDHEAAMWCEEWIYVSVILIHLSYMGFIQVLREEFGSDDVGFYSADTFNEMAPPSDDPAYLTSITQAIYKVRGLCRTAIIQVQLIAMLLRCLAKVSCFHTLWSER